MNVCQLETKNIKNPFEEVIIITNFENILEIMGRIAGIKDVYMSSF